MSPSPTLAVSADRHEDLWERLLQYIEDGTVVPVVGQELVTLDIGGESIPLYDHLARQLAAKFGVALPAPLPRAALGLVASRFLESGGEPERIYSELQRIFKALSPATPSPILRKLAAIEPFRLFISTTLDSMLSDAISAERKDASTEVVTYSPANPVDLPEQFERLGYTYVFQLLGRASSMQDYVVTEEDALEFLHNLLFNARPKRLFGQIHKRHLLILGCSFPTWIVRFFIRASRESRLLMARGKMDIVVDSGTREDLALVSFLQTYKTRTEVFDTGTAAEFVEQLHSRWSARAPQAAPSPSTPAAAPWVKDGAVFISYASDDRPAAESIRDALEEAGMEVWFDRHDLNPGDDFERRIKLSIEAASLFVPLLSRSCFKRNRRFLQLEWDFALREARKSLQTGRFIIPIFIEDLRPDDPNIPEAFQALHAARLEGGRLPEVAIRSIRDDYRKFRERRAGL